MSNKSRVDSILTLSAVLAVFMAAISVAWSMASHRPPP